MKKIKLKQNVIKIQLLRNAIFQMNFKGVSRRFLTNDHSKEAY